MRISILSRLLPVLLSGLTLSAPVYAQGIAGPYLAARQADYSRDFAAAVKYGIRAITKDPQNASLMEGLLIAEIGLGQIDQATPIAHRLQALEDQNQIAALVLLAAGIRDERWDDVQDILDKGLSIGAAVDGLIRAWVFYGKGDLQAALEVFDEIEKNGDPGEFANYHKALILALSEDFARAAKVLSGVESGSVRLSRQGVIVYAQILSQIERNPQAVAVIDKTFGDAADEEIKTLRAELAAGKPLEFDEVRTPAQALSDVFTTVAQVLARELQPDVVLLYARTAEYLDPSNTEAGLLAAGLLEMLELHNLSVQAYARVPKDDRLYLSASLSRAEALRRSGGEEEAISVLQTLATTFPDNAEVQKTLGDTFRFMNRCADSLAPYDRALALSAPPAPDQWSLFFARGICREQTDRWPEAEADFLKALELNPDQPSVLNYLGYSWVEKHQNLDQALDMIERAVAARPEDGFITDSLGWVNYRLGNYPAAVKGMERAVELIPVDPVLNDHLGDVYWAVGRRLEARFQWRRALSFISDEADLNEIDPDRIRRKLEVGLDVVLEEEGAAPLKRSDEGG